LRIGDVTEIANLNRARKAKVRAAAQVQAAQNRAAFGRTKAENVAARAAKAKSDASLDGHKREP
jgi:hypothetical protein